MLDLLDLPIIAAAAAVGGAAYAGASFLITRLYVRHLHQEERYHPVAGRGDETVGRGAADPRVVDAIEQRQSVVEIEGLRRVKRYLRSAEQRGGMTELQSDDLDLARRELDAVIEHASGSTRV